MKRNFKSLLLYQLLRRWRSRYTAFRAVTRLEKKYGCKISPLAKLDVDFPEDLKLAPRVNIGAFTIINVANEKGNRNSTLEIGADTYVGELNNIRAGGGKIIIGQKCLISQNVNIIAANHNSKSGTFIMDQPWIQQKNYVIIGDDVWVGAGATILPGVEIGKGAIIGAGSVVTANVESNAIVVGIPARFIRYRT